MKKTQRIDLITTIRGSVVSFFAITMFVALGVGLFLGIHWVGGAMHANANERFAAGHAHHFEITFPYGLTADDLAELADVEGVDEVEAGYLSYQEAMAGSKKVVARVGSLPQAIDAFIEVEGALPEDADEIALEAVSAASHGYEIGDTVAFLPDVAEVEGDDQASDPDGMRYLNGRSYTVTALVESPAYLASNPSTYGVATIGSGGIDLLAWVPEGSFDADAFRDGKPYVLARSNALAGLDTFSDAYERASAEVEARVAELADRLGDERFNAIYREGQAAVDEGQALYDEKSAELEAGRLELEESRAKLDEGERALEQGKAELAEKSEQAERQLAEARQQLDEGQSAAREAQAQVDSQRVQLSEAERQYAYAQAALGAVQGAYDTLAATYNNLSQQLAAGAITAEEYEAQLAGVCAQAQSVCDAYGVSLPTPITTGTVATVVSQGQGYINQLYDRPFTAFGRTVTLRSAAGAIAQAREKLAEVEALLAGKLRELEQGERDFAEATEQYETEKAEAEAEIAEGERQVEEGKEQIAQGEEQLSEGQVKLEEASAELEAGREALASLVDYSWIVAPRAFNGGIIAMDGYTDITNNLRWSMASLFLIVGILVCYSAVSRLVHEQATRVGTKKAVGFREGEVRALFLAYAAACVAVGSAIGGLIAVFVVENIMVSSMGGRFVVPTPLFAEPVSFALIVALEFVLILGATWFAVRGVLARQAVELLAGERPPSAKPRFYERWAVWRHASLLVRTTVNNCLNDTRRVVGTLVGVAGCTALIVCAVTLNDNVARSFTRQYEAVNHYDALVSVVAESDAALEGVGALQAAGMEATEVFSQSLTLEQPDGTRSTVTLFVPMDEGEFDGFFSRVPTSQGSDEDGVWVSAAYHEHLGAQVGDEVVVSDSTGKQHAWPIAGFFEYHLINHQMVMSAAQYEDAFGVEPRANRLLVRTGEAGDAEDVAGLLRGYDGYVSTRDDYANNRAGFDEFSSVARIVVAVYLALAAVMAACVLLNLDFMFVDEKKRELIVLMINGYSLRDAKGYIWHDSVVLTALGIACGVALGNEVGALTVRSIERANSSFLHTMSPAAVGAGVAGSVVLAAAALVIALRRIEKFDLTDINRF